MPATSCNRTFILDSHPFHACYMSCWRVNVHPITCHEGPRCGGSSTPRPGRFTPVKETRYPLYQRLGGSQGLFGKVRKIALTGIRSPDRPARSQSLYRPSYRGPSEAISSHQRLITQNKCNDLCCRLPWGMLNHQSPRRLNGNAVGLLSVTDMYWRLHIA